MGSDWPVAPIAPLVGIAAAVTRRTIDGANPAGWLPGERVTAEQALHAYTLANAHAGFQESRLGRIAPGCLADIVLLDGDPLVVPADRIAAITPLRTFVGGVERYTA
jgi:predicted amidohydrolase YtcJ